MRVQPLRLLRAALLVFCGALLMQIYHLVIMSATIQEVPEEDSQVLERPEALTNTTTSKDQSKEVPAEEPKKKDSPPCGGQFPDKVLNQSVDWQAFYPQHYAYSAFFDRRLKTPTLKITAVVPKAVKTKLPATKLACHVWYKDKPRPVIIPARYEAIGEGFSYPYQAVWIACIPPLLEANPIAVGVSDSRCRQAKLTLPVHTPDPKRAPQHQFTVCICGPIKFNYSDANQFVEWIETNSLFGAEKFVAYDHSTNASLQPYVDYYEKNGRLDYIPWHLPLGKPDIKNFGHMVLLSDCLYRNMYKTKYITFLDLDEILVPKSKTKWYDILQARGCTDHASSIFKNVFFKLEWPVDEERVQNQTLTALGLKSVLYTKREGKIWPHKSRSKYITRPELLLEPGVHYPHKYLSTKANCNIPSDDAWVQHYRNWDDPKPYWVIDKTMDVYADQLIHAANQTHSYVKHNIK